MHLNLRQSRYHDSFDWIFSQIKHISGHHDQVLDIFIVYFQETDPYGIFSIYLMCFHLLENFFHRVEHDSWVLFITKHCVCLSCSSLAVGEDGGVVAIEYSFTQELGGVFEDFELLRVFVECKIESVLLFLGSILAEHLLFVHNVCGVHQYDYICIQDLDDAYFALFNFLLPHRTKSDCHHNFIDSMLHFRDVISLDVVSHVPTIAQVTIFLLFVGASCLRLVLRLARISKFPHLWLVQNHGLSIRM
jgi:hypothetical protein